MNSSLQQAMRIVKSLGKRLAPKTYARLRFKSMAREYPEPELHLLPCLCNSQKTSLDIGAAGGLYTAHLLRLSQRCIAFEPRPQPASDLRRALRRTKIPASVEAVALSDRAGQAKLRILVDDPGRSTIEAMNLLEDEDGSPQVEIVVLARRLDDYALDNVGFIKIDVEGHELAVLRGGAQTIRQNRPALLMEIEDRHRENALSEVTHFMTVLGYSGFFLHGRQLRPLGEFNPARHQDSRKLRTAGPYINNFIFIPTERAQAFLAAAPTVAGAPVEEPD